MKKFFGILILIAIFALILKRCSTKTEAPSVPIANEAQTSPHTPEPSVTSVSPTKANEPAQASHPTVSLEASAPKLETIQEEIAKNPHETPPAIKKFAADLGEKMQIALQSESEAQKLFPEIANCALDVPKSTYASTPRALCFNDANRLAQKYPSLEDALEGMKRDLEPERLKRFNQFEKVLQAH